MSKDNKNNGMSYRDERDKCYGVASMAVGLEVYHAERLYGGITIDAEGARCIHFTPEYYFEGNPRLSPSMVWKHLLSHFRASVVVAIAGAMGRQVVLEGKQPDQEMRDNLLEAAFDDGEAYCQLDRDEVQPIFEEVYNNLLWMFNEDHVHHAINVMADTLQKRRSLSRNEVSEMLQRLNIV